jgi:hypothetical protein
MSLPRLLLVAALLFTSTAHANEVALSAPRFIPATGAELRRISSIASGGGTELVAWTEQFHSFDFVPITGRVFIRTYGADGAPLQPAQIAIGFGSHPVAVWNGTDYVVAFGRFYSRYGTFLPSPDVEAVRVTSDGRVIDGSRVSLIETRSTGGNISALAWDGTHYLASVSTDGNTKLLLLDREGHVVRAQDGFALSIAALPGGGFAMVRSVPGKLELVRVTRDGDLAAPATLGPIDRPEAKIDVHGDRIAVAWHTASGVVAEELDNDAHVLVSVALPNDATIESIVWRESGWVVAYDRTSAGCIVRFGSGVASSTTCSDTARQPFAGTDRTAWIAPGVEVRTSRDLSLAGGDVASASATTQSDAAAVAASTGSIVAWFEAGAMHVGGLTRDGSRRPDRIIDAEAEAHHPAMATAGAQTLLVYVDGNAFGSGTIRALRLDANGQPLAPAFTVGHGAAPSVATDGREWLIVWQSSDGTKVRPQVLAARVTANGDATAEVLVFANDAAQYHPLVAWSGAGYVVAWVEGETAASGTHSRVMSQLVDRNGTRIANELTLADDVIAAFNTAAIACGPKSCLVAWNGNGLGIFAAVVAPDGTRSSENRQLLPFLSQSGVSIAAKADGTFRLVQENRYLFLDSLGARLADVTWLSSRADVAGMVGGRIVYVRATAPEELLGGAMRLFAREEPSLPRMRAVER